MNKFEKILLTLFFVELFAGGGGRLIDFGFLSIRQVLFLLLVLTFMFRIVRERAYLDKQINTFIRFNPLTILIYLLIGSFVFASITGFINDHSISDIVTDFLRVSFIGAYFPLAYYITDDRFSKERVIKLLKYCALAVSLFTIIVSILGKTVFSADFYYFWSFMNDLMNDDLFFRPSRSVFYKSHLFVLIALIISLNAVLEKKYSKIDILNLIFCSISVLWSETRGFLLAFMVAVITIILLDARIFTEPLKKFGQKIKAIFKSKQFLKKMIISMVVVLSVPVLFNYMTLERFENTAKENDHKDSKYKDKKKKKEEVNDVSVNSRVEDIYAAKEILSDPVHLVLGAGYGQVIGERVSGIEMSFLDILVEQGLIGLAVWLSLCLLAFYNYHVVYKLNRKISTLEISLLAAFMGMLLLTNINPFINNPIGIVFFLFIVIMSQNRKEKELIGG
jgi:cell division protein FtsL